MPQRLFIAIGLPEELRRRLGRLLPQPPAGVKPVRPEQLHLTLHFLGDVDEGAAAELAAAGLDGASVPAVSGTAAEELALLPPPGFSGPVTRTSAIATTTSTPTRIVMRRWRAAAAPPLTGEIRARAAFRARPRSVPPLRCVIPEECLEASCRAPHQLGRSPRCCSYQSQREPQCRGRG